MDEIKVWTVDGGEATPVQKADVMSSELLLERTLVAHPELLMPNLKLVGRQTPTEGGPLDLLGVDDDGRLVVFELKRGTLSRDAVAQVIDYASYLDSLDDDALASFIALNSGRHGIDQIDDFQDWYAQNTEADGLEALRPIRTILVGLGVDDRTERMVSFLAKNSRLDISLVTFYGFAYEGKTLLARQMSVKGGGERPPVDREAKRTALYARAEKDGISDLFGEAMDVFRTRWNRPGERPRDVGITFLLPDPQTSTLKPYARVGPEKSRVRVAFFGRSVQACRDEFAKAIEDIPFETYPKDRNSNPFENNGTEIQFLLTLKDWHEHKSIVEGLARKVHETWQPQYDQALSLSSSTTSDGPEANRQP